MTLTVHLIRFVALVEMSIYSIFSKSLSLECSKGAVVISKLLCNESKATTNVILSYMVLYSVIADCSYWTNYLTLVNIELAFFLYSRGLATLG